MKERKYMKVNIPDDWERIDTFLVVDRPFKLVNIRTRKNLQDKQNKENPQEQEN